VSRFDWVSDSCELLALTGAEFERTQPFAGLRIGTGIHLEPKTAALLLVLQRGGADVVSTGNLNSTQQETCDYLRERGLTVIGGPTADPAEHDRNLREVLASEPDLLLDNGGDLFSRYLEAPWDGLHGGTEETTSGRDRLLPLRDRIAKPLLVINDSPIKQFGENTHAVGPGTVEAFMRITNRITNGRHVTVFGYGSVGRGVAMYFRNFFSVVSVVEPQPVLQLRAVLDGMVVPGREAALADADVIVTVTGAPAVITAADLAHLRDGAVLMNAGHLPWEIDVPGMTADPSVASAEETTDGITTLRLADGRAIHLLTGGHMVNLAGPRPLGNSIESMDLGFTLQARCLEAVANGSVDATSCVVPVPASIDDLVASTYVALVDGGRHSSSSSAP
jgi:adenosylhomocysteinase